METPKPNKELIDSAEKKPTGTLVWLLVGAVIAISGVALKLYNDNKSIAENAKIEERKRCEGEVSYLKGEVETCKGNLNRVLQEISGVKFMAEKQGKEVQALRKKVDQAVKKIKR